MPGQRNVRVISQIFSNFRVEASRRQQVHRVFTILSGTITVAVLGLVALTVQIQPAAAQQPAAQQPAAQQPAGQQPAQKGPQWKDQAEYDMYSAVVKETDPKKKLALINAWKDKYPETEYKLARLQLYL